MLVAMERQINIAPGKDLKRRSGIEHGRPGEEPPRALFLFLQRGDRQQVVVYHKNDQVSFRECRRIFRYRV